MIPAITKFRKCLSNKLQDVNKKKVRALLPSLTWLRAFHLPYCRTPHLILSWLWLRHHRSLPFPLLMFLTLCFQGSHIDYSHCRESYCANNVNSSFLLRRTRSWYGHSSGSYWESSYWSSCWESSSVWSDRIVVGYPNSPVRSRTWIISNAVKIVSSRGKQQYHEKTDWNWTMEKK